MNNYNTMNYTAQGGNETVIGGKLTFLPGAEVEGLQELMGESRTPIARAFPDSAATTVAGLKDDFNVLLRHLREAGIIAPSTPNEP